MASAISQGYTNSNGEVTPPPGSIMMYMGRGSLPSGWLFCDGTAYYRTGIYANLYSVLGSGYNLGIDMFTVPDFRGYFVRGATSTNAISTNNLGSSTVTLTTDNMPSHSHGVTDNGHSHSIKAITSAGTSSASATIAELNASGSMTTESNTTGISIQPTGSGTPFNILPPYYEVNYIIKL